MTRLLAYVLTALILLQTLGPEVLVANYALHKAQITARYCVNKARPARHCDGKCYLGQQLRRAAGHDSKAPNAGWAKVKWEALPPLQLALPAARPALPVARCRYAALPAPALRPATGRGVFQPPAGQS